jgi:hypothetical protein
MGRSVAVLSQYSEVVYFDVTGFGYIEGENDNEPEFDPQSSQEDWDDFVSNIQAELMAKFPSFETTDPYVVWKSPDFVPETNEAVYSDRLLQYDWDKYNRIHRQHFGNESQGWRGIDPAKIEAFLKDYFAEQNLRLVCVMEGCNVGNGYPYWVFFYRTK